MAATGAARPPAPRSLRQITPFGQERLGYRLVLPDGWRATEDLGDQEFDVGRLVRLGLFTEDSDTHPARVQVSFCYLPLEVGLLDWTRYQADRFGVELNAAREVEVACGPAVVAEGLYGPRDNLHRVRLLSHADDARIFHVLALAPADRYAGLEHELTLATTSFQPLLPTGSPALEQWLDAALGGPAPFRVAHPLSWSSSAVAKQVLGKSAVDIRLGEGDRLMGYVRVKAVDPTLAGNAPPGQYVRTATEELRESGVSLSGDWGVDEEELWRSLPGRVAMHRAVGRLDGKDFELRFGLWQRGAYGFAITLLSVPRGSDPVLWMRSKRAYEIALRSARPAV